MTDKLDINTATKEELDGIDDLQGHGHEIVRYREERGGFTSLRELDEVPGLTGKVGEEALKRLTVQK
jgi:competence ComEA-like helix-hairpin-helix protein